MADLLDITGDDVAKLGDEDLRVLIGLLCEADFRFSGLSPRGITWGGNQDAADGGLDVVVRSETAPPYNSHIQRIPTGFQVKKPDMAKTKILKEMKPKGVLREEIKNLIQDNGAYIIVSSEASTTEKSLGNRIEAMREAVADEANCQNLSVDFFDRGRVATWLRVHPSLILWVRNRIGHPFTGWSPFDNWAKAPGGLKEEFLRDDRLRLHDGTGSHDQGISVEDGMQLLRSKLSKPGSAVRLVGLSGVGKTRLVQALFDERVGEGALNQYQVYYTDMSSSPNPDPNTFAQLLIAERTRAILIIDNCSSGLHRQLTNTCLDKKGLISLLTVEYDVRDDIPEDTEVFRLEPSSDELIEKLIQRRFPHISQFDAQKIAEFSSGNARVAISLANTMQQGDTLSRIRDEELFERLFRQRHGSDPDLLVSAEACSLVYSFQGTDTHSDQSELRVLASLVGRSVPDLFRAVEELRKRELIQARDVWRALLPHAIANRLAKRALESIPKTTVVDTLLCGPERLLRSFTRRLSYLHDCTPAVEIVNTWLEPDGFIGKAVSNFTDLGMAIFENIAPVSPAKALEAIERTANGDDGGRFASRENTHYHEFALVLRHLAYEPELFDRSVNLICRFALAEGPEENRNSSRDILKSLFFIHLSGTNASTEARAKIIEELLDSSDAAKQELGLILLGATLETWHFSSSYSFEFGGRPRDFGYSPETHEDIANWYKTFIRLCTKLALSNSQIADQARKLLSNHLRGLWTNGGMYEEIESSAKQIQKQRAWSEGWIAVRGIIRLDKEGFSQDIKNRLDVLERVLKPRKLLDLAHTYTLSEQNHSFTLEDDYDTEKDPGGWQRTVVTTRNIGFQVAQDEETLNNLLPELVSSQNIRLGFFGEGLAQGARDKKTIWQKLCAHLERIPQEKRQIGVLKGFLSSCAENDPSYYNATLDSLIHDDLLGEWFPILQANAPIDPRGIERLHKALDFGKARITTYSLLAWVRFHETVSDEDFASLLEKILSKDGGVTVVIEILRMRFHDPKEPRPYSSPLIVAAQKALSSFAFKEDRNRDNRLDHELTELAEICLGGQVGQACALELCSHLSGAIAETTVHPWDYPHLLNTVARIQPFVFLDGMIANDRIKDYHRRQLGSDYFERRSSPTNQISDRDLLAWCDHNPRERYPLVVSAMRPFSIPKDTDRPVWKPVILSILKRAPVLNDILDSLARAIRPSGWSGSLADILQKRLILLEDLFCHGNEEVRSWAKNRHAALQKSIAEERHWEAERHRNQNETFE